MAATSGRAETWVHHVTDTLCVEACLRSESIMLKFLLCNLRICAINGLWKPPRMAAVKGTAHVAVNTTKAAAAGVGHFRTWAKDRRTCRAPDAGNR